MFQTKIKTLQINWEYRPLESILTNFEIKFQHSYP